MHMSTYCNHHMEGDETSGCPTAALDAHIRERQVECIQPTDVDIHKCRILADAGGQGAKLTVDIQNLDSLGYIQGRCGFLNDLEILNMV